MDEISPEVFEQILIRSLSLRAQKILKILDIINVNRLLSLSLDDLNNIKGCSKKVLSEITTLQNHLKSQIEQQVIENGLSSSCYETTINEFFMAYQKKRRMF